MNSPNPYFTHKFNPNGPSGYLITFRSYGTWLHGDGRGTINRKGNNIPGSALLPANPALLRSEKSRLKIDPVTFSIAQREILTVTINEVCNFKKWELHAVNVRTQHVHTVVTSSDPADFVMNSFKSWCTRRMRENQLWKSEYSPWSRHGSTRYLWSDKDLQRACWYVIHGQS